MTTGPRCHFADRWPDLWAQLPTDADRVHLSASLAQGAAAGMEPPREDVEHLVELYRCEVGRDELAARVIARTVGFPWQTRGL